MGIISLMEFLRIFLLFLLGISLKITSTDASNEIERKPYIVYLGDAPKIRSAAVEVHHSLLYTAIGDDEIARESIIHSYGKSFNGFVAKLLPGEAKKLSEIEGIVSVFPNTYRKLHTTRSWDFIGFPQTVRRNLRGESNVIVGMLDTGIWPDSPSFNDRRFGPPPSKWKGKCETGANFTGCNKKLIGAQYYRLESPGVPPEIESPADTDGHGTHTSSIVVGNSVKHANLYGLAAGTARGGAPGARIAMYKVCWDDIGCSDMDILAAFDDAISDGVDILSLSLGGPQSSFFTDTISIGSFHAMAKGILTSCSAGNDGPDMMVLENAAPWILTVAASSTDRMFRTKVMLGNGKTMPGISINTFKTSKQKLPLISGSQAANHSSDGLGNPSFCELGTLDERKVKGKIVYCLQGEGGEDENVQASQGAGILLNTQYDTDTAFSYVIPTAGVDSSQGDFIQHYINSTKFPTAIIFKSAVKKSDAPVVASFSSRGPSTTSIDILKPDITAPGVDILAAYSRLTSLTGYPTDNRYVGYNILSGTSMACPHTSGAAAYVKSFHPHWSPAAIKSALMTTATELSMVKNPEGEFSYGSGQINPVKAVNPGLVYDLDRTSYIQLLCKEGMNGTMLDLITGYPTNCTHFRHALGYDGLNYPTISAKVVDPADPISFVFRRIVTNVGPAKSVYKATVKSPIGLSIKVVPTTLAFAKTGQEKSFKVIVRVVALRRTQFLSGSIVWTDGKHRVRSPVVIYQQFLD